MLTAFLVFFPMFMFLLLVGMKHKNPKWLSLGGAVLELILTIYAWTKFNGGGEVLFDFQRPWLNSIGMNFMTLHLAIDGISLPLLLLTNVLVPFIILSSTDRYFNKPSLFYGLVLLMQAALVGVFVARDVILFYLFWELALLPIFLICIIWTNAQSNQVFIKFFIYTLAGSLFMLAGIIYVYIASPFEAPSFDMANFYEMGRHLPAKDQSIVFWAIFLAFAIKMPVFPFHTWQPLTYSNAPAQGSMLLAGIMLKMGIFGAIRWLLPVVPLGVAEWGTTAVVISVIGIVYASAIAIAQGAWKLLIAYSSIAHVGLIAAGVFTGSVIGVQGAMIQMLSHGLVVFGLFYCVELMSRRLGSVHMKDLGGLRNLMPTFSTVFLIIILASVALPLTSGFVGEFMLINSLVQYNIWIGAIAGLTIILGAVYMLAAFRRTMLGEVMVKSDGLNDEPLTDLTAKEKVVLYPVVALILLIGVYPNPLLHVSEQTVTSLLQSIVELTASIKP